MSDRLLLNFYSTFNKILNTLGVLTLLITPFYLVEGYTTFYDFFSRSFPGDFFSSNYFYYWTTFWYIPIFILLLVYFGTFFLGIFSSKIYPIIYVLLISSLLFEHLDYFHLNTLVDTVLTRSTLVNPLLTNSINKYHPLLLYSVIASILVFLVASSSALKRPSHYELRGWYLGSVTKSYIIIWLIFFTLFLGSWWAVQEGSWGGWWNWDSSEVFGMMLGLTTLLFIHSRSGFHLVPNYLNTTVVVVALLGAFYCFIQLNFSLVSHNFGIKSNQLVDPLAVYYIVIIYLILVIVSFSKKLTLYVPKTTIYLLRPYYYLQPTRSYLGSTILIVLALEILYSLNPLINDFIWNTWGVNWLAAPLSITYINLLGLVIFFVYFFSPTSSILVSTYFFLFWSLGLPCIPLILFTRPTNLVNNLHYTYYLLIMSTFIVSMKVDTLWYGFIESMTISMESVSGYLYLSSVSYSATVLEHRLGTFSINHPSLSDLNLFSTSTSSDTNPFNSSGSCSGSSQALMNGIFGRLFAISVLDNSLILLLSLLSLSKFFAVAHYLKKKRIIF